MALKSKNPELKVLLSVGGWSHRSDLFSAVADGNRVQRFAENTLGYIIQHKFDGIDIDWQYPGHGFCSPRCDEDIAKFPKLLIALKEAYQPHGLLVTAAVAASPMISAKSYPKAQLICDTVDWVFINFLIKCLIKMLQKKAFKNSNLNNC